MLSGKTTNINFLVIALGSNTRSTTFDTRTSFIDTIDAVQQIKQKYTNYTENMVKTLHIRKRGQASLQESLTASKAKRECHS